MNLKRCPRCEVRIHPTDTDTCPYCSRSLGEVSQVDDATSVKPVGQSEVPTELACAATKQSRINMAMKVGGIAGLLVGWIVWHKVGGLGGFLLAVFLVVPIVTGLFVALFSAISGGAKRQMDAPIDRMAIWSLSLGVSSILFSILTSIPAVVCGHIALLNIKKRNTRGFGLAIAGLVIGYIITISSIFVLVAMLSR